MGSPLKVGKTKNSLHDSVKYLSIVWESKENAWWQKLVGKNLTPAKSESEEVILTFNSGHITQIIEITDIDFA